MRFLNISQGLKIVEFFPKRGLSESIPDFPEISERFSLRELISCPKLCHDFQAEMLSDDRTIYLRTHGDFSRILKIEV